MAHLVIRSAAVLITGLVLATTAGCTATSVHVQGTDTWTDRMETLLTDSNGDGGASGTLTSDAGKRSSSAEVELGSVDSGQYDVLSVCRGSGVVHLRVLHRSPENDSGTFKPLASMNVVCGATTRLPITIPGHNVVLKASGTTGADWVAQVVTRGWEPDPNSVE